MKATGTGTPSTQIVLILMAGWRSNDARLAQGTCPLDAPPAMEMVTLFTLDKIETKTVDKKSNFDAFEYSKALDDILMNYKGGEFSLYFANCEPNSAVSFDLQVRIGVAGCRA